jgi:hypothetical protein
LVLQSQKIAELRKDMELNPLLKLSDVRLMTGFSYNYVLKLVRQGVIPVWRSSPKGHYRVRFSSVKDLIERGFHKETE